MRAHTHIHTHVYKYSIHTNSQEVEEKQASFGKAMQARGVEALWHYVSSSTQKQLHQKLEGKMGTEQLAKHST